MAVCCGVTYYYYLLRQKAAKTLQMQYTINKTLKTKKLVRKSIAPTTAADGQQMQRLCGHLIFYKIAFCHTTTGLSQWLSHYQRNTESVRVSLRCLFLLLLDSLVPFISLFQLSSVISSVAGYDSSLTKPGQLNLAIPPWVGAMSTGDGYDHR